MMKYSYTEYEGYTSDLLGLGNKQLKEKAFQAFPSAESALNKFAKIILAPLIFLAYNLALPLIAILYLFVSIANLLFGPLDHAANAFKFFIMLTAASLVLPFIIIASPFINLADFIGSAFNSCFEQGPEELPPQNIDTGEAPAVVQHDANTLTQPQPTHYSESTHNNRWFPRGKDQYPTFSDDEQSRPTIKG